LEAEQQIMWKTVSTVYIVSHYFTAVWWFPRQHNSWIFKPAAATGHKHIAQKSWHLNISLVLLMQFSIAHTFSLTHL